MNELEAFASSRAEFYRQSAVEQLLALLWFSETVRKRATADKAYIRQCFREAGTDPPDLSIYLPRLAAKRPPQLIKERSGYRLAANVRRALDRRYGLEPAVVAVSQILQDLPSKVPDISERAFLAETLNCYRVKAYRAAIVMAWNLAFDHLLRWIVADPGRIAMLNAGMKTRFPKKNITITGYDDFQELKESEVIEACRTSDLLSKNITSILKDKLNRRNLAAHPSTVEFTQHQADDTISDLVLNVVSPLASQ